MDIRRFCACTLVLLATMTWAGCRDESYDTPPPKPQAGTASSAPAVTASRPAVPDATTPVRIDPHSGMMMPPGHAPIGGESMPPTPTPGRVMKFTAPAGWKEEPPASMRVAQYRIPRAAGDEEDGLVAVSTFPSMRGRTQMNIDRWISQFSQPDGRPSKDASRVTTFEVAGMPVTVLSISGTYDGRPNYRMFAAILDTPDGPWFVKMTGPAKTIGEQEAQFDAFVKSARY